MKCFLGTAANVAVLVGEEHSLKLADCRSLIAEIIADKEFDKVEERCIGVQSNIEHLIHGMLLLLLLLLLLSLLLLL